MDEATVRLIPAWLPQCTEDFGAEFIVWLSA